MHLWGGTPSRTALACPRRLAAATERAPLRASNSLTAVGRLCRGRRKAEDEAKEAKRRNEVEEKKRKEAEEAARKAALTEDDFKDDPVGLSDFYKDKGNASYKQKQFDEAISWYSKALDANKKNVAVLTNRAAVHFETKNYDGCIADCKQVRPAASCARAYPMPACRRPSPACGSILAWCKACMQHARAKRADGGRGLKARGLEAVARHDKAVAATTSCRPKTM